MGANGRVGKCGVHPHSRDARENARVYGGLLCRRSPERGGVRAVFFSQFDVISLIFFCCHSWISFRFLLMDSYKTNTKRIARNTLMRYFRQILIMAVSLYTEQEGK